MKHEFDLIDSHLTDFNCSDLYGYCTKNGKIDRANLKESLRKRFNNGATGIRLSLNCWGYAGIDGKDRSDLKLMPFVNKGFQFDLEYENKIFDDNLEIYCEELSKYSKYVKPRLIVSIFHKYHRYKDNKGKIHYYVNPWFENLQGIKGWYDYEGFEYVKTFIRRINKIIDKYPKIVKYIEIANEMTGDKQIDGGINIFGFLRDDLNIPLNKIMWGVQKIKEHEKNENYFVNTQSYRYLRTYYEKVNEPLINEMKNKCLWSVHQFFKNDSHNRIQIDENASTKNYTWYWSTDGDTPKDRPGREIVYPAFKKVFEMKKNKPYLYNKFVRNMFFEGFSYENDDICYWINEAYFDVNGRKLSKNWGGYKKEPVINVTVESSNFVNHITKIIRENKTKYIFFGVLFLIILLVMFRGC